MDDQLNQIRCIPECGFLIQSHDPEEVKDLARHHLLAKHHATVSEEDLDGMMEIV
jgi:predicted small metal-binding protein